MEREKVTHLELEEEEIEMEMEMEEESGGGLEARQRRRSTGAVETPAGTAEEERAEGGGGGEAEQGSVYYDADQAYAAVSVEIGGMKPKKDDQIATWKELTNGQSGFKSEMINDQEDIPTEEANHVLKNMKMENGSKSHCYSETHGGEITESEDEIAVHEQITVLKKNKLKAVEFDLEKILEEQDTHDLYCPNCNSCITKRVILRKRKRMVREVQRDVPSKRVHEEQSDAEKLDTKAVSGEVINQTDAPEPDVFRCLSCFSFFIPTEGGFNIFRIFEKEKETHVRSSEQVTERKINWISSIFKVDKSKKNGSEPGAPLTAERKTGETSTLLGGAELGQSATFPENNHSGAPLTAERKTGETSALLGGAELGQSATSPENNHSVMLNGNSYTVIGEEMTNHYQTNKENLGTIVPGRKLDGNGIAAAVIDADIPVSGLFSSSFKNQMEDQAKQYDPATQSISTSEAIVQIKESTDFGVKVNDVRMTNDSGVDAIQISQRDQIIQGSEATATEVLAHPDIRLDVAERTARETEISNGWDVLKSIVYGGLIESITSLGVVSSAAGADASTLNIIALGLANLIGGFLFITHELFELRSAQDESTKQKDARDGRYWELLGRRANFRLHFVVAIISYILVGLVPPVVYGFSFRRSDNKEHKLIAVAAASLLCIALLAIGKAHVKPPKAYIKTLFYYVSLGVSASGISYVAGVMVNRLLEKLGLFDHSAAPLLSPPALTYQDLSLRVPGWASY